METDGDDEDDGEPSIEERYRELETQYEATQIRESRLHDRITALEAEMEILRFALTQIAITRGAGGIHVKRFKALARAALKRGEFD